METALNIKALAKERGITLSSIAKKLGMARSNMSAIASGARGVSLAKLRKISDILDCGMDELFAPKEQPVFNDKKLEALLELVEAKNYDGLDKTWVNRTMFAHKMHYKKERSHEA